MWQNPATQRNVQQLRDDGIMLFGPAAGDQACGEVGLGRMLEPASCWKKSSQPSSRKSWRASAS
jgi:phosphopantothenoylcysteine synthetase/decarboxylase